MSHDSDRRTHADALRRHNRSNQASRFKRQAGVMLTSVALGAMTLPYAMLDKTVLQATGTYYFAQAKAWFAEGTAARPTMVIRVDGIDYAAPTDAVIAHPYYRDRADAAFSKFKAGGALWLCRLAGEPHAVARCCGTAARSGAPRPSDRRNTCDQRGQARQAGWRRSRCPRAAYRVCSLAKPA